MAQTIAFSQNLPLFKYLKILKVYPPQKTRVQNLCVKFSQCSRNGVCVSLEPVSPTELNEQINGVVY
jgi:hypothetical protein